MKGISLVLNNFQNDNRVHRIATALNERGHEMHVVALKKGNVLEHEVCDGLRVHRVALKTLTLPENNKFFGALKYAEFFFKVISKYRRMDVWHCNDFEAFGVGLLAKITRPSLKLVYDAHEYERERFGIGKGLRWFISTVERIGIPYAESVIAVSPSIVKEYQTWYKPKSIHLLRNTPHFNRVEKHNLFREQLKIRDDQRIFLYQGGIVAGRGVEALVETFMQRTTDDAVLVVMGEGNKVKMVQDAAAQSNRVFYVRSVPYTQIMRYSSSADVCLNNFMCLPNKFFEYIQAGLPIISNYLPDCKALIEQYKIGMVLEEYTVPEINRLVNAMLEADLQEFQAGLKQAGEDLNWEKEEKQLDAIYAFAK
jgi:glycosyltransferase involved in cell wall biosynthesis